MNISALNIAKLPMQETLYIENSNLQATEERKMEHKKSIKKFI